MQCLHSVAKAMEGIDGEVFVVDNNSVDGSVKMLKQSFGWVKTIANKENVGFSRANNQAIRLATGSYILLLNPDTIVEEDTFRKVIRFMDSHPDAGGLGVKMVDGKGRFLPESKRGLPTPMVSFYKIFGFSRLFPKSRRFSRYHLGHLDKDQIHKVDVLAGAFMLLRKSALDKTGLLDETFFMYGEDIDLSYRITKAGYNNYYFPETRIIHYKGESTKKGSINYVFVFYHAMIIFARKHFSQRNAVLFSFLINMAIYFRAALAIAGRFWKRGFLPMLDAAMLSVGVVVIKNLWESNVIFSGGGHFPLHLVTIMLPTYILVWLLSVFVSGGYDKPIKMYKILRGYLLGTILILAVYGLLSEDYRFSRAVIIFGALWGSLSGVAIRYLLRWLGVKSIQLEREKEHRYAIIADKAESKRITQLLRNIIGPSDFIGLVAVNEKNNNLNGFLGDISQIKEIIRIYDIDELIFSAEDYPAHAIIDKMDELRDVSVNFKIAPPKSYSIIGSNSISTIDDLYIIDLNSVTKPENRRNKRLFDLMMSGLLLLLSPVVVFLVRKPLRLIPNLFRILVGKWSFVGYEKIQHSDSYNMPRLKPSVLTPVDAVGRNGLDEDTRQRLNLLYVRNYTIYNDLNILYKGFRNLGRKVFPF
jgi:GT2 family glycosyltransferase